MTATELLFDRSPVGLALHDAELRFTRVNDAIAEVLSGKIPARLVFDYAPVAATV